MIKNIIEIKLEDLVDFIYRSKLKCFAGTEKKANLTNETSIYSNRELPWCYTDIYWGNTIDRGLEDVSYAMIPVWSMQYRGGLYEKYWNVAEDIIAILKTALSNVPKKFPVRGPNKYIIKQCVIDGKIIKANVLYENKWEGTMKRFKGEEYIYIDDEKVFYHDYIGGVNRSKYYPIVVKD